MNIQFEYLYRDYGNFKRWGVIVFSNPNKIDVDRVVSKAEEVLIDGLYFWPSKVSLPDLHFEKYIDHLDHGWHEFHLFGNTDEAPTDPHNRRIEEFLDSLCLGSIVFGV